MYEMYPDAWTATDGRRSSTVGDRPRRRIRKERLVPAVLDAQPHRASTLPGAA